MLCEACDIFPENSDVLTQCGLMYQKMGIKSRLSSIWAMPDLQPAECQSNPWRGASGLVEILMSP